jgi:endonuclease/exonuclease/phosphatase family metal-dependent hydrolase
MVDVFREQHGYGELDILDVSHATQTNDPLSVPPEDVEGKRFDHVIASANYLTSQACYYDQAGFCCSDHAPLIAEFTLSGEE